MLTYQYDLKMFTIKLFDVNASQILHVTQSLARLDSNNAASYVEADLQRRRGG